jgi:hypothetical protein
MNGKIDELRVWDDARSASEIQANMYTELIGNEQGLVAYYNFNETSGTIVPEESTNSGDGTMYNMTGSEWEPSPVLHSADHCLSFDGTDDYVSTQITRGDLGSAFTIEFWFRYTGLETDGYRAIIGSNDGGNGTEFFIGKNSGNNNLGIQDGDYYADAVSGTNMFNGTWHHIAFSNDNGTGWVYLNGILKNTLSFSGTNAGETLFFGCETEGGGYYHKGDIDEIRIWNDIRSESEIRQNMYRQLPDPDSETNLIAYYKFDATEGLALTDYKNGNTGTLTNMAGTEWQTSSAMYGSKNCLEFDATNDYIEVPTLSSPFSQGTISFWIKPKATPTNHARVLSDYWDDDEIYLFSGAGNVATWHMISGDELMSSDPLPNNTWTHVAITMDNISSKLYINGVLDDESGPSDTYISSDFEIGGYSTSGNYEVVNGYLDEFCMWSTVLTQEEIREYMCKNLTGNEANLLLYYNLNNSSGTTVQDFSGNGNDGTFQGLSTVLASGTIDWTDYEMSFRDYDASWVDNAYYGKTIRITTPGKEQEYVIAGNSSNQIFLNFPDYWSPGITAGDTYEITETASDATWANSSAFNTWLSTASNNFSEASNWSLGTVPSSTDNIGVYGYSGGEELTFSGSPTINNLFISSTASPVLGSNITVNGNLIMESNVDLNGNTVNLGMDANLIEENGLFYGNSGKISTTRVLNGSITPINENIGGIGAEITCAADMGSTVIERHHSAIGSQSGINGITRYYVISPTNNSGLNATLVFHYDDSELNGNTESGLVLHKSTDAGATWNEIGGTINTTDNTIVFSNTDGFSWWTAAQSGTTLPVELISFNGAWESESVKLQWTSATETNVAYFRVYRSSDNINFEPLTMIPAAGNSSQTHHYGLSDQNVQYNTNYYYYLNEMSFDGQEYQCSPTILVRENNSENSNFNVFPNPFDNQIYLESSENIQLLEMYNSSGKEIPVTIYFENNAAKIQPQLTLPTGVYLLKIYTSNGVENHSIIKK